jgi:hypothetical protein
MITQKNSIKQTRNEYQQFSQQVKPVFLSRNLRHGDQKANAGDHLALCNIDASMSRFEG